MNKIHYRDIVNRDPDGQPEEPTEKSYAEFEAWVRRNYGDAVWRLYNSGEAHRMFSEPNREV